jgi:3-oxoacyl-[acyl-carrier protein] reductase
MRLDGSIALVTGGSGGLGQSLCLALARAGAHVALVYLKNQRRAEEFAARLQGDGTCAVGIRADITTAEGIDRMVQGTLDTLGRIDVLINNAAYNRLPPLTDLQALDEQLWTHILHYDLTAPYLAMRAVAPVMKGQGAGRIVSIASIAGIAPSGSSIAYAVAKAGLIHLTRCMALALAPEILVNAVAPGLLEDTGMTDGLPPNRVQEYRQSAWLRRTPNKDDVGDAVLMLLRTGSITGQTVIVDAGGVYH